MERKVVIGIKCMLVDLCTNALIKIGIQPVEHAMHASIKAFTLFLDDDAQYSKACFIFMVRRSSWQFLAFAEFLIAFVSLLVSHHFRMVITTLKNR